MIQELKRIKKIINPHEIIYVVVAMARQDIINVVSEFNLILKLTGLIITKIDMWWSIIYYKFNKNSN